MEAVVQRLVAVTLILLVSFVSGVECWTETHTYATGGSVAVVVIVTLCWCLRRCITAQRLTEERPARRVVVVSRTQTRVIGSSSPSYPYNTGPSIPSNPYNTGYDQPTIRPIPNNPAANAPPSSAMPCQPPPYDQSKKPTDPYNSGYNQPV